MLTVLLSKLIEAGYSNVFMLLLFYITIVFLIDPNKNISSYEMPLALQGHTILNIEEDVFMLIGGWNFSHIFKETFIKSGTMAWKPGPPLNIARYLHTSGLITDQITQKKSVVVVGGQTNGYQVLTSIEILPLPLPMPDNLTDGQWQTGTTPKCFH